MILTKEEIDQMTQEQAQANLHALETTVPLDKPYNKVARKYWDRVDDIANTLLWLEDRIAYCQLIDRVTLANQARWSDKE